MRGVQINSYIWAPSDMELIICWEEFIILKNEPFFSQPVCHKHFHHKHLARQRHEGASGSQRLLFSLKGVSRVLPLPDIRTHCTVSVQLSAHGLSFSKQHKGEAEDKVVGWHHRLNGHEFVQTLGDRKGQRSLVYCSPQGRRASDMTKQLSNSNTWNKDCGHVPSDLPRNECPGLWSPKFTPYTTLCALCQGIKV